MSGHHDMSTELHEQLVEAISSIVQDMTTTTVSPEEEIADEYNSALLAKENAVQVDITILCHFWGVSDPLCLSFSSAPHFFRLFFSCPPPC
jgi:hypothetical protein